MTEEATQAGAELSITDRIAAKLEHPEPEAVEATEPVEDATDETVDASAEDEEAAETLEETPDDATEEIELDAESLAALVGVDTDALHISEDGEISFNTKIDGQVGQAKLADLLKSYQLEGHVNKKSMEIAEQQRAVEAQAQQMEQAMAQRLQAADLLISNAENELLGQFNSVNWDELRSTDPGEFAALQTQYGQRYQQIQHIKQQASQVAEQRSAELRQKQQQQHQQIVEKERDALLNALPAWRDQEVAAKEFSELSGYLKGVGFPEEAIANEASHLMILTARKAMLYDQMQAGVKTAEKKVKRVLKTMKPKASTNKDAEKEAKTQALRKRVKSGDRSALVSLLESRIS